MKKFPKIKYPNDSETDGLLNDDVVVTEKLDGANFRFTWDDDGNLEIGTRNHTYSADDENIPKAFTHAVEYIQETVPDDPPQRLPNYTLYGEAMHLHSLHYQDVDYVNPASGSPYFDDAPNVVIFDAQRLGEWLPWDTVTALTRDLGLERTRVLERGHPDNLDFEIPDESMFGGPPEGIVVRRLDGQMRAKKVTEQFKEKNATTFNDATKAQSDAAELVAMFVTPARVEKMAHRLVDEGEYDELRMQMMEQLPARVLEDIMSEEGWNLLNNQYGFECTFDDDFKSEVRSKTSKKCARVLKTELQQI